MMDLIHQHHLTQRLLLRLFQLMLNHQQFLNLRQLVYLQYQQQFQPHLMPLLFHRLPIIHH